MGHARGVVDLFTIGSIFAIIVAAILLMYAANYLLGVK